MEALLNIPVKKISIIRNYKPPQNLLQRESYEKTIFEALKTLTSTSNARAATKEILGCLKSPYAIMNILHRYLGQVIQWVHITGAIENRIILLGTTSNYGLMISLGSPITAINKVGDLQDIAVLDKQTDYVAYFHTRNFSGTGGVYPKTFLISLYHPENFPLPRFALGISDIARAIRKEHLGNVRLFDMQLGTTIHSIISKIRNERPKIIGVSATFGQQDLLSEVIRSIKEISDYDPLLVAGGSLAVLNKAELLLNEGVDFVAVGAGEKAMQDIIEFSLNKLPRSQISDIAYYNRANDAVVHTSRIKNREYDDIMPELDLLEETLSLGGVLQLESSRGCSYACSFCPRAHKGMWAGEDANVLKALLPEINEAFNKFPKLDKRVFLVDEEFVGYQSEDLSQDRCLSFARQMKAYGFKFETSSRIDQVVRRNKDRDWHIDRMKFWKKLKSDGLSRCLFGIESGVDSILERFNKKTTSLQNVNALRTLSALNIPIRCTYITFDPLMSFDELKATHEFLGRTDLVIKDMSFMTEAELYDGLQQQDFVERNSKNVPFYHFISYMLVSMEALVGSPYLAAVEAEGLALEHNLLMGRKEVRYRDQRIGLLSNISQRWVDRNFSLDYTLKSIEKIIPQNFQGYVRECRVTIRSSSYDVLSEGINLVADKSLDHDALIQLLGDKFLERHFESLKERISPGIEYCLQNLPHEFTDQLKSEFQLWESKKGWVLINGVCE